MALLGMRYICEGLLPILEYPLPIRGGGRLAKQWRRDGGATTVRFAPITAAFAPTSALSAAPVALLPRAPAPKQIARNTI